MKVKLLIIITFILFCTQVSGQKSQQQIDSQNLGTKYSSIKEDLKELNWSNERKKAFSRDSGISLVIDLDNESFAEFQYQDLYKSMIYYKAFNSNVASKINLAPYKNGSIRNLTLTGMGIIGGVWDERRAKLDHPEFTDRLVQVDGSSQISVHATHVSGTIFAQGINPLATGFANYSNGLIFDWNSDTFEMLDNAYDPLTKPNGILVSNHSYGQVLGWQRNSSGVWNWFGNDNISVSEDHRFGFYSQKSQALDNIAYEKPFYSIVWAAGNDRNDIGDGSKPVDGPDDTIGPEGVSKNIFTVGAIADFEVYDGPSSLVMSNFSSWGPTDDGRIKPDIVSIGVGVFSTSFSGSGDQISNGYSNLSGTSMAAPTVTGSLMLLQDLSKQISNKPLKSSTLKAMLLHTALEAGNAPGPDYRFGWGLLNFDGASDIILNNDGENNILFEGSLRNGEKYSFDLFPDEEQLLKVTVVWTDPAGTPIQTSNLSELLNNSTPNLVNDLDVRIFNENGKEYFPWSLDPSRGGNAIASRNEDNFRDNVEQVLIDFTDGGKYTVVISHKNELVNDHQDFSLISTTKSSKNIDNVLYWIGQSGEWNNASNWSLSFNGPPANIVPNQKSRVIFDNKSGSDEILQINLSGRVDLFAIEILGDKNIELIGNNAEIFSKKISLNNKNLTLKNINLTLENSNNDFLKLDINRNVQFQGNLIVENSNLFIKDLPPLNSFKIIDSEVKFDESMLSLSANSIFFEGNSILSVMPDFEMIAKNTFVVRSNTIIDNDYIVKIGDNLGESFLEILNQQSIVEIRKIGLNSLSLSVVPKVNQISLLEGKIEQKDFSILTDKLTFNGNTEFRLKENLDLTITDELEYTGSEIQSFLFEGISGNRIFYDVYEKKCFENWNVLNIDLVGRAILNLEGNSAIINSANWLNMTCEEVLFADFIVDFPCLNSSTIFQNLSDGNYKAAKWNFPSGQILEGDSVVFSFIESGEFNVSLEITNGIESRIIDKNILIRDNPISKPTIVINGNRLSSFVEGTSYQWFLNNSPIVGADSRTVETNLDGLYQVLIYRNDCNYLSDPIVITSLEDEAPNLFNDHILIFPNPTSGIFNVSIQSEYFGDVFFEVFDSLGRLVSEFSLNKTKRELLFSTEEYKNKGLYFIRINLGDVMVTKKLVVN